MTGNQQVNRVSHQNTNCSNSR